MSNIEGFEIENGILKRYTGNGKNAVIPSGVIGIGSYAFYKNKYIQSVIIPKGVTYIGTASFYECVSLRDISIPEGVKTIGWGAFVECRSLECVILPNSTHIIEDSAFFGCRKLKNIEISDGITYIGKDAFCFCKSLRYTVYRGGKYLGNRQNPYALLMEHTDDKICEIHRNTRFVYSYAFGDCSKIQHVEIPENVSVIGDSAFDKLCLLESIDVIKDNDAYTSVDGALYSKDLKTLIKVPCAAKGYFGVVDGVEIIKKNAFRHCLHLTHIFIPNSVSDICEHSFYGVSRANITYLGSEGVLSKKTFGGIEHYDLKIIAPNISLNNTDLKRQFTSGFFKSREKNDYDESEYYEYIKNQRYYYLKNFDRDIVLFMTEKKLIKVEEIEKLTDWAAKAGDAELSAALLRYQNENFTISERMKSIFKETLKDSLSVGNIKRLWAYEKVGGCIRIKWYKGQETDVVIPQYIGDMPVAEIGEKAFSPDRPRISGESKQNMRSIKSIIVPDSIMSIGKGAFRYCSSLQDIVIPESVTYIGDGAFYGILNVVIHAPKGSYAIKFAKNNNVKFLEE